jgi:hypothetical protein
MTSKKLEKQKKKLKEEGYKLKYIDFSFLEGEGKMGAMYAYTVKLDIKPILFVGREDNFFIFACKDQQFLNQFTIEFLREVKLELKSRGIEVEITNPAKEKLEKEIKRVSFHGTIEEKKALITKRLLSGLEVPDFKQKTFFKKH